jgi:hypothetical protein
MMFTFPWEGHTQHARWDWNLFLVSPNYITFLFIMYFGRFRIVGLPRIYIYLMLLMYFYFIFLTITFPKKNYFCTMKNSEHNRHNSLSTPPLQTIANLALTTSLTNVALRNAFVGNFDNICQKGFFLGTLLLMLLHDWASTMIWLVHLDTNTTLCHVKIKST